MLRIIGGAFVCAVLYLGISAFQRSSTAAPGPAEMFSGGLNAGAMTRPESHTPAPAEAQQTTAVRTSPDRDASLQPPVEPARPVGTEELARDLLKKATR